MQELFVRGITLPRAYHSALRALYEHHDEVPVPDYKTNQKEASVTFVVENPLEEPMISRLFVGDPRSLEQYRQEICDGILDFEVDKGNWHYTYHDRIVRYPSFRFDDPQGLIDDTPINQLRWVIDELKRNPDSRRAVIDVRHTPSDMISDSPACLQNLQFFIRNDMLHMKVLIRSNDAAKAAFMNAFAFIMLQKKVADQLGLPVGTYTHRANSFHVYEKDYEVFDAYYNHIVSELLADLTYDYIGDWDEMMQESQSDIARMVEEQKKK